jgi:hypothetical protein
VIIDRVSDPLDSDPCRIRIQIIGPGGNPAADHIAGVDPAARVVGPDGYTCDGQAEGDRVHIVVDYLDPDGPTIRRIEPPCSR